MYAYRFVDDNEITEGQVSAPDAATAALKVLGENRRFALHAVRERDVCRIPAGAELVELAGWEDNSYYLDIRMIGTRKRKPLRLHA